MAESSHTSTAQEGVTPLLLLQTPAWEEVPSNPQLSAANETPLPQWIRPINEGLQRIHEHLINTPLVMKSDDVRKAYEASIVCYTAITAPLAVGLEINDTQATAFQTRAKETFDSFMSESWRHIAANAKTTKERQQAVNQLNQHHKAETTRLRDQLAQAQIRIREQAQEQDQARNPSPAVDVAGAVATLSQALQRPTTAINPIQFNKPATFDGTDLSKFRAWWDQIQAIIETYPEQFREPLKRIHYVGSNLRDNALIFHQHRLRQHREQGQEDTWEAYSEAVRIRFTDPAEKQKSIAKLRQLAYKRDTARYITEVLDLNAVAKLSGRPLREIIERALPEKIIELIAMSQEGEPDDDDDDAYFNALRKAGRHYDKYSARKRDESSIPAATHKSKAEDKPKEKEKEINGKALPPTPAPGTITSMPAQKENQYPRQPVQELFLPPWSLPIKLQALIRWRIPACQRITPFRYPFFKKSPHPPIVIKTAQARRTKGGM